MSGVATDWLTAGEARARLGVQAQTLYAYVSRGLIRSERVAGVAVEPVLTRRRRTPRGARAAHVEGTRARDRRRLGAHQARPRRAAGVPRLGRHRRRAVVVVRNGGRVAVGDRRRTRRNGSRPRISSASRPARSPPCPRTPRSPTGCASRPPRSARCDPLRNDRRRPRWPRAVVRSSRRWSRAFRSCRRPRRRPQDPIATRFWPRLSPLTATAARGRGARPRHGPVGRPRARCVDARGARRRVDVGRSVPARVRGSRRGGWSAARRRVGSRAHVAARGHRRHRRGVGRGRALARRATHPRIRPHRVRGA